MLAAPASKIVCGRCQGHNVETAKFCNYCGGPLGADHAAESARAAAPPQAQGGKKVCPGCERINELSSSFCYDCGSALPRDPSPVAVGDPAHLRARLLAGAADLITTGLLLLAVETVALFQTESVRSVSLDRLGTSLRYRVSTMSAEDMGLHFLIVCLIYLTVTGAAMARSAGQMLAGVRVIRRDGSAPSWGLCLARAALSIPLVGLLWIPLSQHNRALQDLATGTRVVTTRS